VNHISLILGGARSGKSRFALELGQKKGGSLSYLATAEPLDKEMALRIARHRAERGSGWKTIEAPVKLAESLSELEGGGHLIVIDCLTLWLSNLLMENLDDSQITAKIENLLETVARVNFPVIAVSNEVGLGIVPADPLSRRFRDLAGFLHQGWAKIAQEVYWMTAGIPSKIKG